jgi:hypothetical protein
LVLVIEQFIHIEFTFIPIHTKAAPYTAYTVHQIINRYVLSLQMRRIRLLDFVKMFQMIIIKIAHQKFQQKTIRFNRLQSLIIIPQSVLFFQKILHNVPFFKLSSVTKIYFYMRMDYGQHFWNININYNEIFFFKLKCN